MSRVGEIREIKEIPSKGFVLIDFHAVWCGPCKIFGPVFEEASREHSEIHFAKCDIDHAPEMGEKYNIQSIPTCVLLHNGVELNRFKGSKTKADLKEWITAEMKKAVS